LHQGASKEEIKVLEQLQAQERKLAQERVKTQKADEAKERADKLAQVEDALAMKRAQLTGDTQTLLALEQEVERAALLRQGASREEIKVLEQLQAQERSLAQERVKTQKADEAKERADKQLRDRRREETQRLNELNSVLSRILPDFQHFGNALIQLQSGNYFGAATSAIHGFLDVLGVAQDSHEKYQRQLLAATRAIQQSTQSLQQAAASAGGDLTREIVSAQYEAIQPILRVFEELRAVGHGSVMGDLEILAKEFGSLGDGRSAKALKDVGISVLDFRLNLRSAFGKGSTVDDVLPRIFSVRDAFQDLGETLEEVNTSTERSIRVWYDAQRQALAVNTRSQFLQAGADPYQQRRAFQILERGLKAIDDAQRAAARRASQVPAVAASPAGHPQAFKLYDTDGQYQPPGRGGTYVGEDFHLDNWDDAVNTSGAQPIEIDFTDAIDISNAQPIVVDWPDAIELGDKYGINGQRPQGWADVIAVSTLRSMDKIKKFNWPDAIVLGDKYGINEQRPQGWADVIAVSTLRSMDKIKKFNWPDAIVLGDKYGINEQRPQGWADVIALSTLRSMDRITEFNWPDAIELGDKYGINGQRPQGWADVIAVSTLRSMDRIKFNWPDAIELGDKYGINGQRPQGWADVIAVSTLRSMDRIKFNWPDAIELVDKYGVGGQRIVEKATRDRTLANPNSPAGHPSNISRNVFDISGLEDQVLTLDHWDDVIAMSALNKLDPIKKNWTDAISLKKMFLKAWSEVAEGPMIDKTGPTEPLKWDLNEIGWTQITPFTLEPDKAFVKGRSRVEFSVWDVIDFWGSPFMQTVYGLGQPQIVLEPTRIFRIGDSKLKVNFEDVFDISGLEDQVLTIVEKATRDRTLANPNSPAGHPSNISRNLQIEGGQF
jgi:hypothetical protein